MTRRKSVRDRYRRRFPAQRGFTYVEVLVVIGLLLIVIAFAIPIMTRTRHGEHGSSRVKCASNLRQIGQALLLYANDNRGHYPVVNPVCGAEVIPTWGTGASAEPAPNDVTAAIYMLLRSGEIAPEVFTCPTSNEEKWDFGGGSNTALNWRNFADYRKHLSYSMQNPYANDAAIERKFIWQNSLSSEFAMASDMNPGLSAGSFNVMSVTTTSSAREMRGGNSANHDRDGQNVLYGDGHVEFQQNPFVGVQRDNIFTTKAGSTAFTGGPIVASPFDASDSILLPTRD